MHRFQFTLRELFLAMTLFTLGFGGMVYLYKNFAMDQLGFDGIVIFIASLGALAAGIYVPFQSRKHEAITAFAIMFLLMFAGLIVSRLVGLGQYKQPENVPITQEP